MGSFTDPPRGGKGPIRPPLRLAHPAPPPTPKRRASRHEGRVFTEDEQRLLRVALRGARARWHTWEALAKSLDCRADLLRKAAAPRGRVSAAVVVRLCIALRCAPQDLIQGLHAVPTPPASPAGGVA